VENGQFYQTILSQQKQMMTSLAEQERRLCKKIDDGNRAILGKVSDLRERVATVETEQENHEESHKRSDKKILGLGAGAASVVTIIVETVRRIFFNGGS